MCRISSGTGLFVAYSAGSNHAGGPAPTSPRSPTPSMCGRYALYATPVEVAGLFDELPVEWLPRWNIAPTQQVLACRLDPATGTRSLVPLRWGLMPHWASDLSAGVKAINAR